jgi:CheY-like chemotaxis protein
VCGVAASGEEALALARQHRPRLALMDIQLQGEMDGLQTAEVLRSELDVPVAFLIAHSDEATLQLAKLTAPYGFLMKPFDERELQLNIEVALHKHEGERQLAAAHLEDHRLNASLEQIVRERTAELEAALTEIEGFVQAVAHHMRSPLRAMERYSHLLLPRYAANFPHPASRFPEAISSSARHMARLVDDLFSFINLRQQALCLARHGSSVDMQVAGKASLRISAADRMASSGSGVSGASQPRATAMVRTCAIFLRPMVLDRAISRSESPWRMRTKVCLYWYISNFRLVTTSPGEMPRV